MFTTFTVLLDIDPKDKKSTMSRHSPIPIVQAVLALLARPTCLSLSKLQTLNLSVGLVHFMGTLCGNFPSLRVQQKVDSG